MNLRRRTGKRMVLAALMVTLALLLVGAVVPVFATVNGRRVTCADTATLISASDGTGDGVRMNVRNTDAANSVYLGGADVTVDDGFELPFGRDVAIQLKATEKLYCIVDSSDVRVDVLEGSVE